MRTAISVVSVGLTLGIMSAVPAAGAQTGGASSEGSTSSARYLAANCANCHGTDGRSVGAVASLAGYPAGRFIEQMNAFRDGSRPATIMHQLAKGYSETQIAALATYFAAQTPAGSTAATAPAAATNASQTGTAQTPSGAAR
jgi:sulfide dehydrogenase cytochrome subunit